MKSFSTFSSYIKEAFPSEYLRAADISGHETVVKIKNITSKEVFNKKNGKKDMKMVAYFVGKEKGVILSKGRVEDLTTMFKTDNPSDCVGKEIVIYTAFIDGKNQIRFKPIGGQVEEDYEVMQTTPDEYIDVDNIPL